MAEDTICAPATPPVSSSIAIIRISGPGTLAALRACFSRPDAIRPRRAINGSVMDGEMPVDDVVLLYYRSPKSFTGEDMAEIFCHGNPLLINRILMLLHAQGLRMAEPGEFSKRAFLNGKIDLTEAEAINHIISARSEWEIEASIKQMHGSMRERIDRMRERLIGIKADIECGIDFIGEDIEFVSYREAREQTEQAALEIRDILRRCRIGERISHGIDVPIVGKPNVGKSSILNLILNAERALVSEIPGTTRDFIKEAVRFGGIHINLIDTAGIGNPSNELDRMGIEQSKLTIERSSLVIMVIDSSAGVDEADEAILGRIGDKKSIVLLNKADIADRAGLEPLRSRFVGTVYSARTGEGLSELEERIHGLLRREFIEYKDFFVANARMIQLLEESLATAGEVVRLLEESRPQEIVAFELQSLLDSISQITGEITPDDVLDSIFSRICIGK